MEKEFLYCQMAENMKVIFKMIRSMVMVYFIGRMGGSMTVVGKMENNTV